MDHTSSAHAEHEEHGEHTAPFLEHMAKAIFPFVSLAAGLLMDAIARVMGQPILSTVILLLLGFILPQSAFFLLAESSTVVQEFVNKYTWANLNSHEIMLALLPILIFESAFSIEAHEFGKHFWEVIMLAGPCFFVGFIFLAVWMYFFVSLLGLPGWSLNVCMLYSATISATDPVAVVMLLSKLGVPHRLRLLIEGESLLNDGVAIVLFNIMLLFVRSEINLQSGNTTESNVGAEILIKIALVSLSVVCGIFYARMTGWLLGKLQDTLRERAVIVLFVYGTYCTCEATLGSGVLGVVTFALILNSQKEELSAKSAEDNKSMWQFFAYWSNWILFILTGLMASQSLHKSTQGDEGEEESLYTLGRLLGLGSWAYVGAFVCRFASIAIYTLITSFMKKEHWLLPWTYTMVLTWGGLRGSIALLLAMQMGDDKLLTGVSPAALACVSFTVLFSNVYHTLSAKYVADRLNLTQVSEAKSEHIEALLESMNNTLKKIRSSYPTMQAYFWSEALWDKVHELTHFETMPEEEEPPATAAVNNKKQDAEAEAAKFTTEEETLNRLMVMNVMIAYARVLGEREVISSLSVRYTINAINEAVDRHGPLDVDILYYQLQPYECFRGLSKSLKKNILDRIESALDGCISLKRAFLGINYKLSSDWWQVVWHLFVIGHCVMLLHSTSYTSLSGAYAYTRDFQFFLYANCLLSVIFICEIGIRYWLVRKTFKAYLINRSFWRLFDFIRVVAYFVSVAALGFILKNCFENVVHEKYKKSHGVLVSTAAHNRNTSEAIHYQCADMENIPMWHILSHAPLVAFGFLPFLIFYLFPRVIIMALHEHVVRADILTLEIMHGVLLLAEHVLERLESETGITLDSEKMRNDLEEENMKMKKNAENKLINLMNIQSASSTRIVYIKTRQVARMVLSEGLSVLEHKLKSGEIDEFEYWEMEAKFNERIRLTKEFLTSAFPETSFEARLRLVPWIATSKEKRKLVEFIISKAQQKTYKKRDYLMRQDEIANGAFFILSGICRFAKKIGDAKAEDEKPLHLLYAGQFVGEKGFLTEKPVAGAEHKPRKRGGSVYCETEVTAYFLTSEDAMNILNLDPMVGRKLEDNDVALACRDFLRRRQPYSSWTAPALEKYVRNKWKISDRREILKEVPDGATLIIIKGQFEVDKRKFTIMGTDQPKIYDGPMKKEFHICGSENKRCFYLELHEDRMMHDDSASDDSLVSQVSGRSHASKKLAMNPVGNDASMSMSKTGKWVSTSITTVKKK